MNHSIDNSFVKDAIKRFLYYKTLGDQTLERLQEADLHRQPDETSNSIAVIIQHLHGNMMSRWTNFLTEDGEKEWRRRDEEFEENLPSTKEQIMQLWEEGWQCLLSALQQIQSNQLLQPITIRGESMPAYDAILRQLAHYPYHVGQIVYLGRLFVGKEWQSLSIPKAKGASRAFNESLKATTSNKK
ncbi:MAG: DUF1572 family protein [Chitinophagaceae bacterium]|nr:DUF1572 family protein [Chitinophagaceae bacterium]MCA6512812.1 DUF1572 family protein [Chitinophagaceae bacterium]